MFLLNNVFATDLRWSNSTLLSKNDTIFFILKTNKQALPRFKKVTQNNNITHYFTFRKKKLSNAFSCFLGSNAIL